MSALAWHSDDDTDLYLGPKFVADFHSESCLPDFDGPSYGDGYPTGCEHGVYPGYLCYRCWPEGVEWETDQAYEARGRECAAVASPLDEEVENDIDLYLELSWPYADELDYPPTSLLSRRTRRRHWLRPGQTRRRQNHGTGQPEHELHDWCIEFLGKADVRRWLRRQNVAAADFSQLADQFGQGDVDVAFDEARIEDEERTIWSDLGLNYQLVLSRNSQ